MTESAESTWGRLGHLRHALPGRKVDEEGELLSVPLPLTFVWLVLGVLTVLEAINGVDYVGDALLDSQVPVGALRQVLFVRDAAGEQNAEDDDRHMARNRPTRRRTRDDLPGAGPVCHAN